MRFVLLAFAVACGSSPSPSPQPQPQPPQPEAPVAAVTPDAAEAAKPAAPEFAPLPYTAEQLRTANPAGKTLRFRDESDTAGTKIKTIKFVTSDEQGADLEVSERSEFGAPIGDAKKSHATWD